MQRRHDVTKFTRWLRRPTRFVLVAALLTSLPPSAYAEWSKQDQQRQLAYTALHMVGWGQTLDIADQPKDYYETNPVLGEHPHAAR